MANLTPVLPPRGTRSDPAMRVAPPSVSRVLGGPGETLEPGIRHHFEQRFGHDFSHVRVHSGPAAAESARDIDARAYTLGWNIVFGDGQYAPGSTPGVHTLAHELAHVVQQAKGTAQGSLALGRPGDAYEQEADRVANELTRPSVAHRTKDPTISDTVRTPEEGDEPGRQTAVTWIQRDLAIEPPNPSAEPIVLSAPQIADAITYNRIKLGGAGADLIGTLRDVLGISREPPVIDEDFVNAVILWQAANNLTQDGKLGPKTAAPLFSELRAEGLGTESTALAGLIRRGRVLTGPTYTPDAGLAPTPDATGQMHVGFGLTATFSHDPPTGIFASCCEIRQEISWDAAMAAGFAAGGADPVPHAGFPAAHPANTFIEDRDANDTFRYGHRGGFNGGVVGNRYLTAGAVVNQATGTRFEGHDDPHMLVTDHGQMQFRASVVDVCNEGRRISGFGVITINW